MSNFLSTIRSGHVLRPYYYGAHKWDNYLVDIQETIAGLKTSNNTTVSEVSGSDVDELSFTLSDLSSSIEDLGAKFEWGLTLLIDGQERQIKLLNQIVGQLDAIREAVQLPSTTRARELFSLGQNDVRNGFLPEALKKFLAAEQINEVNFPLQLQIGKLLLYGKNQTDDVIDLAKAEKHLLLASRYAGHLSKKWVKYHGISLFHAAVAAYLIGEREKLAGRSDSMQKCLERALVAIGFAAQSWPEGSELYYLAAKCHALLGQEAESLANLVILAERDLIGYAAKVDQDQDFDTIRNEARVSFRIALARHANWDAAHKIMGRNFLGVEEVSKYFGAIYTHTQLEYLSDIPFPERTLRECKDTHILVADIQ